MRDTHKGMPEIVDAFKDSEQFFGVVAIEIKGVTKKLRFGLSQAGYYTFKRVLQLRPFDAMPGLKHRYFYAYTWRNLGLIWCEAGFRVELGNLGRTRYVKAPAELLRHLNWFYELKDFSETAHLLEIK